ncbi:MULTISPECIES: NADH-quinone oxidoreductase subunit NuoE [Pseudonocardia]|uniref:NADH-quinone oxidoreductase subunit E n=2 Tax=Pseudonocardia TaxID=1847 RepID=A0A1Y2N9V4_PSEAH|nr:MULTISPECIES: NADH-quinone oxidoreductase subunit NuoE [Pseudonocardia]OSY44250.1 NADH-quinone oxidoreductase subunit E [Pseudonocardia autotrophica]TDN74020.1 NADH dehydrogenase subunit E [Pseudonocardia autotrophica]BBG04777.1 NADH-quinone oxidoreductase subunit E [Pseudonocardia autotrophica]GEC23433.1 NADH-quinone oxidoreductase subunit E [Pseudonocardia saturnea]
MTLPEGNPESNSAAPVTPTERQFPAPPEPSPVSPIFDEVTRQRTKEIISLYPQSRSALLPLLHLVQSVEGYVSTDGIRFCAEALGLTTAEVSAVATFYTMYKRSPCGEHLVSVCTNTLCAALGGDDIYERLRTRLGSEDRPLRHEETAGEPGSPGSITLEHAECLAACDLAPVLQVNYEYFDNQTVDSAVELVDALRRGEKPQPTRGAPLTDLRTVELELAGFTDDAATVNTTARVEGPSAAIESVRGVRLAEENGWTAPAMPDEAPAMPALPEKK